MEGHHSSWSTSFHPNSQPLMSPAFTGFRAREPDVDAVAASVGDPAPAQPGDFDVVAMPAPRRGAGSRVRLTPAGGGPPAVVSGDADVVNDFGLRRQCSDQEKKYDGAKQPCAKTVFHRRAIVPAFLSRCQVQLSWHWPIPHFFGHRSIPSNLNLNDESNKQYDTV